MDASLCCNRKEYALITMASTMTTGQYFTHLRRHLLAIGSFMTNFTTKMTGGRTLLHLVFWYFGNRRQFETRMHVFACGSVGAKSGQIICAQNTSHMPMTAQWTMPTKAAIIPWAIFDFTFRIDVQEWAFFVMACVES